MKKNLLFCLTLLSSFAFAQDLSLLRPPKGAQVALIVFEDLQCPKCRSDAPVEAEAARAHKIPLIHRDFPLPGHSWSYNAAVIARYFETQSKPLGAQFRAYIFEHQPEITPDNLQSFAQKFATDHNMQLPFVLDPQGKLAALVNADREMGVRLKVAHTPTIYVVGSRNPARPFIEVQDVSQLFQIIEAMQSE